jgi:hypothetical protein
MIRTFFLAYLETDDLAVGKDRRDVAGLLIHDDLLGVYFRKIIDTMGPSHLATNCK